MKNPEALAYISGVILGDGYIKRRKRGRSRTRTIIVLESRDYDFVENFAKLAASITRKKRRYAIMKRQRDGQFITEVSSRKFYQLYKSFVKTLPKASKKQKIEFLKGFFDAEGSPGIRVGKDGLTIKPCIGNSKLSLLKLVQKLLRELGIVSKIYSPPHSYYRDCIRRKKYYYLVIHDRKSLRRFAKLIGFTISRKREKFFEAYRLIERYGRKTAAMEWRKRYRKERNRWIKKKNLS